MLEEESKDYWRGYLEALSQVLGMHASSDQTITMEMNRVKALLNRGETK